MSINQTRQGFQVRVEVAREAISVTEDFTALVKRALEFVPNSSRIGLGSGHTVEFFFQGLAERVQQGLQVVGVPSSETTARRAAALGIPLGNLTAEEPLTVTIDGADEVEVGTLNLIKGWGGALVRERIVAAASRQQIILVSREKLVERLGERGKLPLEILPFAAPFCRRRLAEMAVPGGLQPVLRGGDAHPFVSDNGNWIFDCALHPQHEPALLERSLRSIPGVVDTGLFLGTASLVLVAEEGGAVRELTHPKGKQPD